jgi:bifunctional non-homologous end joining protein LigD
MDTNLGRVHLTNLGRIMYPSLSATKKDVIEYYIRIAPGILPFLADRALVMQRFPDGAGHPGFYEKDAPAGTPGWVSLFTSFSRSAGKEIRYVVSDSPDTLIWLANLAALELNIPLARIDRPETPDMVFFDLDPEPPAGMTDAALIALSLQELLSDLGLVPFVKTSGKKGLHVVAPLVREYSFDETRNFVHAMGALLAKRSGTVVSEISRTHDPGTVFVDYLQNAPGKTMICPYSLRATEYATVSMPLAWSRLAKGVSPEDFTLQTATTGKEDPWKGFFDQAERLPVVNND